MSLRITVTADVDVELGRIAYQWSQASADEQVVLLDDMALHLRGACGAHWDEQCLRIARKLSPIAIEMLDLLHSARAKPESLESPRG